MCTAKYKIAACTDVIALKLRTRVRIDRYIIVFLTPSQPRWSHLGDDGLDVQGLYQSNDRLVTEHFTRPVCSLSSSNDLQVSWHYNRTSMFSVGCFLTDLSFYTITERSVLKSLLTGLHVLCGFLTGRGDLWFYTITKGFRISFSTDGLHVLCCFLTDRGDLSFYTITKGFRISFSTDGAACSLLFSY